MRKILETSGISAGGAYNYFAGKADIVKGIAEEERDDIEFLEQRLGSSDDPLVGLAQLVADIIGYTDHESAVLSMEIHAESCRNAEIAEVTRANTARLKTLVSAAISRGRKAGVITVKYTVAELTEWVVALFEGYIGRIASNPDLKPGSAARTARKSVLQLLAKRT